MPYILNISTRWRWVVSSMPCPCAYNEGLCGSGGMAPYIFNLSSRWKWVVSLMPWLFYHFTRMWVAQLIWMFWRRGKTVAPARKQTVIPGLISQA